VTALYLIRAACPRCGDVVDLVERTPSDLGVMQDVPIDTRWCPACGEQVRMAEWDRHEETQIFVGSEPVAAATSAADEEPPSNPVQRAARGLDSGIEDGIQLAPCPDCGSFRTYWDELADEDTDSGYCEECGASFALSETVIIDEDDLRREFS